MQSALELQHRARELRAGLQSFLRQHPFRNVADDTNEHTPAVQVDIAHAAIHREHGAVLAAAFDLPPAAGLLRLAGFHMFREVPIMRLAAELGHERVDAGARHLFRRVSENRSRRAVNGFDRSPFVDGHDAIRHPVEHGVEPCLALSKRRGHGLKFRALTRRGESPAMHAMQRPGQQNDGGACAKEGKHFGRIWRTLERDDPHADE